MTDIVGWRSRVSFLLTTCSLIVGLAQLAGAQVGVPIGSASGTLAIVSQDVPTLAPLVRKVTPSVVSIAVKGRVAQEQNPLLIDPFFRRFFDIPEMPIQREVYAAGSGVIVDAEQGLVVTNNHLVEHADEITVTLMDSRRFPAKRLSGDPETDVAIIRIPAETLVALSLGDSDKLEVGDFVVAVGNPFGLGQTVTSGIVSAVRRSGLGIKGYESFIQTDAAINPGNSGGALVNLRGELVGINTAIVGPTGGNVGIGFAIPANLVRDVMRQLMKYGEVRRGQLGVTVQDLTPEIGQAMHLPDQQSGALVARVVSGSAADRAGIKAGDVIIELGKTPIHNSADLRNKVAMLPIGEVADVTVLRRGHPTVVRVTLSDPVKTVLKGEEVSPLLEGATLGPASPAGVQVVDVQAGSRTDLAGLRKGDVITSVNQTPITRLEDLVARVKESTNRLLLNLQRDGDALFIVLQG